MTEIQELQQLSKEDLLERYLSLEQQHRADIDLLSKALVAKSLLVPDGFLLVSKAPTATMQAAGVIADREYFEETGRRNMAVVFKAMIECTPAPIAQGKACEHLFLFAFGTSKLNQRRCLHCRIDEDDVAQFGRMQ